MSVKGLLSNIGVIGSEESAYQGGEVDQPNTIDFITSFPMLLDFLHVK